MRQDTLIESGTVIANTYRVLSKIGAGGMGEVWKAEHLRLPGLNVAIKFLFAENVSQDHFDRFQREAHIMASLNHPHITRVIDLNTLPEFGTSYIILEYLEGESLRQRLDRHQLTFEEISKILVQVGSALSATHSQQIVHRDLKPDNIFLCNDSDGFQVKVLDFGVSKVIKAPKKLTIQQQGFLGTPHYMSPEQALGVDDVTAYADQFALAIILYEMLAGELPFNGDQVIQIASQIVQVEPIYILEKAPFLSKSAADTLHKALSKDPSDRFDSCDDFVNTFLVTSALPQQDEWVGEGHIEVLNNLDMETTIRLRSLPRIDHMIDSDLDLDEDQTSITIAPSLNDPQHGLFSQSAPKLTPLPQYVDPNGSPASLGFTSNYDSIELEGDEHPEFRVKSKVNLGKVALYSSMFLVFLGFVSLQLNQVSSGFDCYESAESYGVLKQKRRIKKIFPSLFLTTNPTPKNKIKSMGIFESNQKVTAFIELAHSLNKKREKRKRKLIKQYTLRWEYLSPNSKTEVISEKTLNLFEYVKINQKEYLKVSQDLPDSKEGEWRIVLKKEKNKKQQAALKFCVSSD
jgi:serine/threonine protein kinase